MVMQEKQITGTKQYRLLIPDNVWEWLAERSKNHDRKPGAEILQILKAEMVKGNINQVGAGI